MSARIDLGALLERAQADNDNLGIWVNKAEVAALVQVVKAAQTIAGFGWDSPYQPKRNDALIALDAALAPFTGGDT